MGFTRFTKNVLNVSALPDRVQNQASTLKLTFDKAGADIKEALNALIVELESKASAGNIGADVSSVATKTVQAILTTFEAQIADRYTKTETETLVAGDTNNLVADVDVNLTTGVITVTKKDGTKETFDTALEKVPAKFEIVENGNTFALKITNVDGTTTQADITQFMNVYNFGNSDEVAFEISGTGSEKTVTASIRANSIGLDKLSLSIVSTLEGYMTSAKDSATAAKTSETNARTSEINAQTAANTAVNKAQEATTAASTATTKASEAEQSAEDAEYWAKQAQSSSQGGDMLKAVYDTDGDGIVDAAKGITVLEASTENVIDFNTLLEPGYYLIKNCNVNTTTSTFITDTTTEDIMLFVRNYGDIHTIYQEARVQAGGLTVRYRGYTFSTQSWSEWGISKLPPSYIATGTIPSGVSCNTPTSNAHLANKSYVDGKSWAASKITAGTFGGKVRANSTAAASTGEFQVRDIGASTADLTAGTSTLSTGAIHLVYE